MEVGTFSEVIKAINQRPKLQIILMREVWLTSAPCKVQKKSQVLLFPNLNFLPEHHQKYIGHF